MAWKPQNKKNKMQKNSVLELKFQFNIVYKIRVQVEKPKWNKG